MRLVPMKLRASYAASSETNHSYSFDFPPTSGAVPFSQPSEVANGRTDGDRFDVRDITDDLKWLHVMSLRILRSDPEVQIELRCIPTKKRDRRKSGV